MHLFPCYNLVKGLEILQVEASLILTFAHLHICLCNMVLVITLFSGLLKFNMSNMRSYMVFTSTTLLVLHTHALISLCGDAIILFTQLPKSCSSWEAASWYPCTNPFCSLQGTGRTLHLIHYLHSTLSDSHLSSVTQLAHWLLCFCLSTSPTRLSLKITFTANAFWDTLSEVIILYLWHFVLLTLVFSIVPVKIITIINLIIQNNCFKYILVVFFITLSTSLFHAFL